MGVSMEERVQNQMEMDKMSGKEEFTLEKKRNSKKKKNAKEKMQK